MFIFYCYISFPSVHASIHNVIFYLVSFVSAKCHIMYSLCFFQSTVILFGCTHILHCHSTFVIVRFNFSFQSILRKLKTYKCLQIKSQIKAEPQWFHCTLSLYQLYQARNTTWCQKEHFSLCDSQCLSVNLFNSNKKTVQASTDISSNIVPPARIKSGHHIRKPNRYQIFGGILNSFKV